MVLGTCVQFTVQSSTYLSVATQSDAGIELKSIQAISCVASQNDAARRDTMFTIYATPRMRRVASRYVNCELGFTHILTATALVSPYLHSMCTSYVLCAYLYCVYVLVGGAISIRDLYIWAIHESVPMNCTLSSTGPLSVQ